MFSPDHLGLDQDDRNDRRVARRVARSTPQLRAWECVLWFAIAAALAITWGLS